MIVPTDFKNASVNSIQIQVSRIIERETGEDEARLVRSARVHRNRDLLVHVDAESAPARGVLHGPRVVLDPDVGLVEPAQAQEIGAQEAGRGLKKPSATQIRVLRFYASSAYKGGSGYDAPELRGIRAATLCALEVQGLLIKTDEFYFRVTTEGHGVLDSVESESK